MRRVSLFLSCAFLLCKCASLSNYQIAETLPPGEKYIGLGFGYINWQGFFEIFGDTARRSLSIPVTDVFARFGILEHLDVGIKGTLPFTVVFDAKYQILPDEIIAVAPSIGVGYKTTFVLFITDLYGNLFISKRIGENFTIYFAPKYIYTLTPFTGSGFAQAYGLGGGFFIGKKSGLWIDGIFLTQRLDNQSFNIGSFGTGVSFGF